MEGPQTTHAAPVAAVVKPARCGLANRLGTLSGVDYDMFVAVRDVREITVPTCSLELLHVSRP